MNFSHKIVTYSDFYWPKTTTYSVFWEIHSSLMMIRVFEVFDLVLPNLSKKNLSLHPYL